MPENELHHGKTLEFCKLSRLRYLGCYKAVADVAIYNLCRRLPGT